MRFPFRLAFASAAVVVALSVAWPAAVRAQVAVPPDGGFSKPLDCTLDRDCWITNLPDAGVGEDATDYRCGARTYNGHKGTDFTVRDYLALDKGVPVLAAAPGTVVAIRNDAPEHFVYNDETKKLVGQKECGNGVVLEHSGGWQSQYCHMRTGSVSVALGAKLERGARLGLAGMSGQTQFPHVHVAFRVDGQHVDPFTGRRIEGGCKNPERSLWRQDAGVRYPGPALYAAGFTTHAPEMSDILSSARSPISLPRHVPALVLWVASYGVQKGDVLRLRVLDPSGGTLIARDVRIDKAQARYMAFAGKKIPPPGWATGGWKGEAVLERTVDGRRIMRRIAVPLDIR